MLKSRSIFLTILLFFTHSNFPALIQGTLVKTPYGLVPIEQLCVGDVVLSLKDNRVIENHVIAIVSRAISESYEITTPTSSLRVSPNQHFYDPEINQWIAASQITLHTKFLDANGNCSLCLSCNYIKQEILVYELSLSSPHTFFITQAEIVVHNFAPVIGISLSWGGKIAIESLVFGLGTLGIKFFKDQQQNTKIKIGTVENLSCGAGGNPEDPDKKKHPYGKYEDASYHHPNSSGRKSQSPKDGQAALDNSFEVKGLPNKQRRIGISSGEFVILDSHGDRLFHGHVRKWNELRQVMKNILIENKLVKPNGKIIR